jgi:hypothetical protein
MFRVLLDIFIIIVGLDCAIFNRFSARRAIDFQRNVFGLDITRGAVSIRWAYFVFGIMAVIFASIDLVLGLIKELR